MGWAIVLSIFLAILFIAIVFDEFYTIKAYTVGIILSLLTAAFVGILFSMPLTYLSNIIAFDVLHEPYNFETIETVELYEYRDGEYLAQYLTEKENKILYYTQKENGGVYPHTINENSCFYLGTNAEVPHYEHLRAVPEHDWLKWICWMPEYDMYRFVVPEHYVVPRIFTLKAE